MTPAARSALLHLPLRGLVLALAGLLFAGCSKPLTPVVDGNRRGILHFGIGSEPTDLDPQVVTGLGEGKVIPALFDPLVALDPGTLEPVPALAERWDVSPDGLAFTFHLRADARWSNGEPITAADCVASWRRILTGSLAADYAYLLYCIRGAEAFHKGRHADPANLGLAAPDARTFVVTLERPTAYFLLLLVNPPFRPVNVRAIAAHGDAFRRGNPWSKPGNIVSSGPFLLKEWSPNHRLVAEKNPAHWNAAHVRLNAIHFYPIDSFDTEERAFRAGQLHVTWGLPLSKIGLYRDRQSPVLRTDRYLDTFFLRFNTSRAPLGQAAVRRALSLAIDRPALAASILKGGQTPAGSIVDPGIPHFPPVPVPARDLAAARRLLVEAGFPGGAGLPPLEILHNNSETLRAVGQAVQEMWRRDLGVESTIRNQEYKVVFADRRAGNYQVLISDWVGDYLDATTYLDLWRSDSGNNHTRWGHPDYDAALDRAAATIDLHVRAGLLAEADAILRREAPIAPLYYNPHVYLIQPAVRGWQPTPTDHIDYQHVWLEE